MMTGEVNYDDLFYSEDANSQLPFPISTKFLFAAFIAIVTIILFNLLIGLTVSDIQGLQSGAELNSLSIQVEEIYGMEKFMTSDSFQNILKCIGKQNWIEHFRVTRRKNGAIASAKVEVLEENIPKHLLHILGRLVWRNEFRLIKDGKKKSMSNRFMNRIKPKGMGPGPRFWQRDQKINQL
ncbi:unnamed protein product [Orchesella dallaii]|uniref:Ion transport domain-containing protein n=1 Tax=Orchesella dallaii TaxID=48710 RepID=A0ABP1RQG6_9HEXA